MVRISKQSQNITVIEQPEYSGTARCVRCGDGEYRSVALVHTNGASMREFLQTLKTLLSRWKDATVSGASAKTGVFKVVGPQVCHCTAT